MGDIESHHKIINLIILYGKVYIHLSKNKEISPHFFFLRNYSKRAYDTEKYKVTVSTETAKFDKEWASLKHFWGK